MKKKITKSPISVSKRRKKDTGVDKALKEFLQICYDNSPILRAIWRKPIKNK